MTRLAIDRLRRSKARRETHIGPWLPEPIVGGTEEDVAEQAEMADSLSMAFLVLLEDLKPVERAVFLLREVFEYDYPEIADVVGKSETNCRQLFARARKRIEMGTPRFEASSKSATSSPCGSSRPRTRETWTGSSTCSRPTRSRSATAGGRRTR